MFLLWRSWGVFTALIATVLSVLAVLSVLQHNTVLSDLIRQRLSVVVQSTAQSFNTVTNLGMPLAMMRNAGEVLNRAKSLDPDIEAIYVFKPDGTLIHSTKSIVESSPLTNDELELQKLSKTGKWSLETDTQFKSSISIINPQGEIVAGIQAVYPKKVFHQRVHDVALRVTSAAALLLLFFSGLTFIVLRIRLAGVIKGAEMLYEWLLSSRNKQPRKLTGSELNSEFVSLRQQLELANQNFIELEAQLRLCHGSTKDIEALPGLSSEYFDTVVTSIPDTSLARVFARRVAPWSVVLILLSTVSLGLVTYQSINNSFKPELAKRTELIAHVANTDIQRAVSAGIPLEKMVGMSSYFEELLKNFPEITFFGVATDKLIFQAGSWQHSPLSEPGQEQRVPIYPLQSAGEEIGYLIIEPSLNYINLQFTDVLLDLAVIVLVVLLLAYELQVVVMSRSLTAPLNRLQHLVERLARGDFSCCIRSRRGSVLEELNNYLSDRVAQVHRVYLSASSHLEKNTLGLQQKTDFLILSKKFQLHRSQPKMLTFSYLNDVRLPLFLFAAADELPLSFFPLFTRSADNPITWLDPAVVISLPLAGYLLAYMFGSPFARSLSERWGHSKLLLMALIPVFLSNLGMFFASNVIEIIVLRTIAGGGYALAVLACQDYVIDVVPKEQRTRSLGIFSAALFGGVFAGTALGGVLADRFGAHSVFLVSALFIVVSGLLFVKMVPSGVREISTAEVPQGLRSLFNTLKHKRYFAVVFGLAIPQSIMDQVFISYLFSLQLDSLNASPSDIARMLMAYFMMIILAGYLLGRLTSLGASNGVIALTGSVFTGAALLSATILPTQLSMLVAAIGAGLGHGLVRGPLVELAMTLSETELAKFGSNSVLGALRLFERIGSVIGLLLIAAITGYYGNTSAIGAIAVVIIAGAVLFGFQYIHRDAAGLNVKGL